MTKWFHYFKIVVLAWALHRMAMAAIGFPKFTFADFNLVEFLLDFGVFVLAFGISSWFLARPNGKVRNSHKERP